MEQEKIFIEMSDDVVATLNDNEVDLIKELQREGHNITRIFEPNPVKSETGTRSITLVLLAAGGTFLAISAGITKIIDALSRRPTVARTRRCVPVVDESGASVKDQDGSPILQWVDEIKIIEAEHPKQDMTSLQAGISSEKGLYIEYTAGK